MHWLHLHSLSGLWLCPNSPLVSFWGWEVGGFSWLCPEASRLSLSTGFIWNPLSLICCHPATSPLLALTATIYLQIFCTFTEGLDLQFSILIIMQMMIWRLQSMGAHHIADQYRNDYIWNIYCTLGSQKTHDVATVIVFASEMVKWKLCTIRLAVVSCQWFPHYVNLFYLNTLLHSTSAVPFLSSSWNLYLHTTAPLPTHSFTLHLLINKCVCNKYLLTTYKVPGQDGR